MISSDNFVYSDAIISACAHNMDTHSAGVSGTLGRGISVLSLRGFSSSSFGTSFGKVEGGVVRTKRNQLFL